MSQKIKSFPVLWPGVFRTNILIQVCCWLHLSPGAILYLLYSRDQNLGHKWKQITASKCSLRNEQDRTHGYNLLRTIYFLFKAYNSPRITKMTMLQLYMERYQ